MCPLIKYSGVRATMATTTAKSTATAAEVPTAKAAMLIAEQWLQGTTAMAAKGTTATAAKRTTAKAAKSSAEQWP